MIVSKVLYNLSDSKLMKKHAEKVINDDVLAARLLVGSNVLKDAIVYAFRYDKSRKNEEIPKEKRGFVAALDLASGMTTCFVQLAIGFAISNRKLQQKMCKTLFGHLESKSPEVFSIAKKGFTSALTLITSGVIGERIIVPLVATPLATMIKNKHLNKNDNSSKANYISGQKQFLYSSSSQSNSVFSKISKCIESNQK